MTSSQDVLSRRSFLERTGQAAIMGATLSLATGKELDPGRKVRIGVVGGGFGTSLQWHAHPNCVVHAVSDLRTDRREKLMKVYGCDRSYESLEKLILDKEIDAVAVFTGVPDHVRHCVAAMNAGKHVICAVPACMSMEEAEQLLEAKKRNDRKYMMAETTWYRRHTIAARELYKQGKFGRVFYSEVEYYHPMGKKERDYYFYYKGERTWRYGFPPIHYPTHSTGFLVGVTGERLTEVSCLGWGDPSDETLKTNGYNNPFSSQMGLFKTDRGHMCRCGMFKDGKSHGERAQWFGTKMTYYMPETGRQPFKIVGDDTPDWKEVPKFWDRLPETLRHDGGHGGSHPFLTHEFVSALIEDREPEVDIYESLAMTVPGIIAHQSSLKGGEQMKIPNFNEPADK